MAFAVKMWNWTKMGARVVVTPGEMSPASFSHPLLVAQKVVPQPIAANPPQADAPLAAKAGKAADADVTPNPVIAEASLELKSTVGHHDGAVMDVPPASPLLRERTHTADAGALPAAEAPVTMTDADAAPSGGNASPRDEAATDSAPPTAGDAVSVKAGDASSTEAKSEAATAAIKYSASESKKADATKVEARADDVKAEAAKPDAPKSGEKSSERPDGSTKAVTDAGTVVPDLQTRLPDTEKPAASKADPATIAAPKRTGQIAVFISRKDSKLYVRQNFAPLFETPIVIAPGDRPLGTHLFTAQVDKDDANVLHWSVLSLPAPVSYAERRDDDERVSRRRKMAGAVEMKTIPVPDSPAEALDRLTIPADAMARIVEALTTGGSIIVSDQGINAGETGEGTDFIVSLR
jgi:hypothetical protein